MKVRFRRDSLILLAFFAAFACSRQSAGEIAADRTRENAPPQAASSQTMEFGPEFVRLDDVPGIRLDVRYATVNNFTKSNLYGSYRSCFLHESAAAKLKAALEHLEKELPGWKFLVFDCLRPRSIQRKLFERVRGTAQEPFVANPAGGSIHNFGLAIDLSLADAAGNEVDMGTPYDDFSDLARPDREAENLRAARLTEKQLRNRALLRKIMTSAGFLQLPIEWWHYDSLPGSAVRSKYKIVE